MRRFLVFLSVVAVIFTACTKRIYIPVEHTEYVTVRDSVYLRDTLVRVELEKARLVDFVDVGDTLVLQTELARSTAFLDTLAGKLKGTLENIKPYAVGNVQVKEKIVYRDSIVRQEVPVPVEVVKEKKYTPWYTKALAFVGILSILAVALKLALKKYKVLF